MTQVMSRQGTVMRGSSCLASLTSKSKALGRARLPLLTTLVGMSLTTWLAGGLERWKVWG